MMEETEANIVQAQPASCSTDDTCSHQPPSKQKTQPKQGSLTPPEVTSHDLQAMQGICSSQTPSTSRFTRSQAAPNWTVQEVLILLKEIAAVDQDWFKALSSYQRWKMISDNCIAMDVVRSSNQCKRKWEMLLTDYMKIKKKESCLGEDSYWFLHEEKRKEYELPVSFQKEVFDAMAAVIEVQQHQSDSNDSDSEHIIRLPELETPKRDVDSGSREEELITTPRSPKLPSDSKERELITTPKSPDKAYVLALNHSPETYAQHLCSGAEDEELRATTKGRGKAQVMADEVQKNAEHMRAILRRELQDGASHLPSQMNLMEQCAMEKEFARRKANELIEVLSVLTNSLNEFIEFINNGQCGEIVPMESINS